MALVVLLKGINVGGHRSFRPSVLAKALQKYDVVNVGAAGTLIARNQVSRRDLQAVIRRRLPFEAAVMICSGTDILRLVADDPFAGHATAPGIIQFVSLMARRRPPPPALPLDLPAEGRWCVRVLRVQDRFVLGLHRREMRAIRYLAQVGEVLGAEATTRSWSTILAVARVLRQ
jgi:uncharacterized protein (DUF1697 family)